MSPLDAAKALVSLGSRILADQNVLDAFGHASCRSPDSPDRFLIPRSLAPALVAPEDVVELDMDGEPVAKTDKPLFLERFIHGEIYRSRPDVHAVVHSHAMPVVPFTIVPEARIRPVWHMCGFLAGTPAPFDIADYAGTSTNLLITNSTLGRHLAEHLGPAKVVPMRSHGFTTVGGDMKEAVFQAIYTMKNCEVDLSARMLGTPTALHEGEARASEQTTKGVISRAWELWAGQCTPLAE